jgi:UPF0755 protein
MKKLALLPFLLIIILAAGVVWFFLNIEPVSQTTSFVDFNVASGSTATRIGSDLASAGLIKNPTAFKIYVQFSGVSANIQAGDYRLSPSFSLFQIVDTLSKNPLEVKVTIQEGLRREEIAAKFAKSLDQNQSFVSQFLAASQGDEGYLFPDTYLIANNATPGAIIAKMKANFHTRVDSLVSDSSNYSRSQLLILASLIERETKTGDERPIVAGILLNRLSAGWPLQVDATVQYAMANVNCAASSTSSMKIVNCAWWEPLASGGTNFNSPYNTYSNIGLPPTPIANPGLSAIKAAFSPASTGYFYYLHDSTGTIHYAKTLQEQNANIKKYLQ